MENFNNMKLSEQLNIFAQLLQKSVNIYKKDADIENEMFKEQNNLLHSLELDELSYHQIARVGKQIRELRKSRRGYKNEYILYEPIVKFVNSYKDFLPHLTELVKDVEKVENHLAQQKYNVRKTVDGLSEMHNNDTSLENIKKEKLIIFNKILSIKSIDYTSEDISDEISKDIHPDLMNNEFMAFKFFATIEGSSSLTHLKDELYKIFLEVAKSYNLTDKDLYTITTSDMLSITKSGNKSLLGQIEIYYGTLLVAKYQGEVTGTQSDKTNKKNKKRKKRRR